MNGVDPGRRNRLFGWILLLVGILGGLVLGTFVFAGPLRAPERFADYSSLPRRLIRFAHIAALALGILNILYGMELSRGTVAGRARTVGSKLMIVGGTLMPLVLTAAAFDIRWKWLLPVPALSVFTAILLLVANLRKGSVS